MYSLLIMFCMHAYLLHKITNTLHNDLNSTPPLIYTILSTLSNDFNHPSIFNNLQVYAFIKNQNSNDSA